MPDRGGHLDPNGYRWYGEMWQRFITEHKPWGEFKSLQPEKVMRTAIQAD